jgi:Domain of unknown function (DUF4157)
MSDGARKGPGRPGAKTSGDRGGIDNSRDNRFSDVDFEPRLVRRSEPSSNPTDLSTRIAPVDQERHQVGQEILYRHSGGTHGIPPRAQVDEDRKRIARSLDRRMSANTAATASIPQSGGSPLPNEVRGRMEPKLGADLSAVRVHTSGESAQAARQLGARAFAVGSDVHFGSGEYAPGTSQGDRLLAHELTHTVQAQRSGIQRKSDPDAEHEAGGGDHQVSDPSEPAEKEADHVADVVTDQLHGGGDKSGKSGQQDKSANSRSGAKGAVDAKRNADGADQSVEHGKGGAKDDAGGTHAKDSEEKGEKSTQEKPPQIAAKYVGVGRKIYRVAGPISAREDAGERRGRRIYRRVEGQVPGLYNSATNVNNPVGSLKEPAGTLVYMDEPTNLVNGKPTTVRTEVEWTGKDGTRADGSVKRSLKLEADGTRTLVCDSAFLDKIPRDGRWVKSDGVAMKPGEGTPLHVYLTMRQMRLMGINEGDIGKQIKKVKISTIVNRRTIWELARALGGKKGTPTSAQILASHSGQYAKNYVIQNGGVVVSASIPDLRFQPMKRFLAPNENSKEMCGIDANQPDTWVPQELFNIIFECGEKRPGSVPDEIPGGAA